METIYYKKLNLTINPLVQHYDFSKITSPHIKIDASDINPELVEQFNLLGIDIIWSELFYRVPGSKTTIHIDRSEPGDYTKINFTYGGKLSKMFWYRVKNSQHKNISKLTAIETKFATYDANDVELVDSSELSGAYLIQVGVPHEVRNPLEKRYCVSFTISDKNNNRITMSEGQKLLHKFISI